MRRDVERFFCEQFAHRIRRIPGVHVGLDPAVECGRLCFDVVCRLGVGTPAKQNEEVIRETTDTGCKNNACRNHEVVRKPGADSRCYSKQRNHKSRDSHRGDATRDHKFLESLCKRVQVFFKLF